MNGHYLELSPGVASLANVIRVAIAEGLYGVDLMLGDESYKDRWANSATTIVGLDILYTDVEYVNSLQRITRSVRERIKVRTRVKWVRDFFRSRSLSSRR